MIDIVHVTKKYGDKTAVSELTLQVGAGELFAFLGPNGAGKTTTIKLMCGLLFPTEGSISIGGHDIQTEGQQARQLISYIPDQPYLYEKLTGREIMQFVAQMYSMPKQEIEKQIEHMIELFELDEFVDDLTEHYSHGMRQRTVFASALMHNPKLLIVDEPTVGLDPRNIRRLKDLLKKEAARGCTVFLSTHSLDIAQQLADRIGVIRTGSLIGCGTLESLQAKAEMDGTLEEVFLKLTEPEGEPPPSEALFTAGDGKADH